MDKKFRIRLLFLLFVILVIAGLISYSVIQTRLLRERNIAEITEHLFHEFETKLLAKKEIWQTNAVQLANNPYIVSSMSSYYRAEAADVVHKTGEHFRDNTNFHNVRIHLIDRELRSFVKSWNVSSYGDLQTHSLLYQKVIAELEPVVSMELTSIGPRLKAVYPVMTGSELVGLASFEGGLNSIKRDLEEIGIDFVYAGDYRNAADFSKDFTDIRIGDYLVSQDDLDPDFLVHLQDHIDLGKATYTYVLDEDYLTVGRVFRRMDGQAIGIYLLGQRREDIEDLISSSGRLLAFVVIVFALLAFVLLGLAYFTTERLEKLKLTQSKLLLSERMAAIGDLVSGVFHEVNNPISVGKTASTFLIRRVGDLRKQYEAGSLTEEELVSVLKDLEESAEMLESNMDRAVKIISLFKKVAVDRETDELSTFNLGIYLEELVFSLKPRLKKGGHLVSIQCEQPVELRSYPGTISQVFTNLILNSVIHGFEGREKGSVKIEIREKNERVYISYSDDGHGISEDNRQKVFDPFFTTKKGEGGTGLGMHIAYSLVTEKLQGDISLGDCSRGVRFYIEFPRTLKE